MSNIIAFTKVRLPYGWLGNMAPYPVVYQGVEYQTTEHLFQALRFMHHPDIVAEIIAQASPMAAKLKANSYKPMLEAEGYEFLGDQDIMYMIVCLKLKLDQHPELHEMLLDTGNSVIVEDCTNRPHGSGTFWGAVYLNGEWHGENTLGHLWMELRENLR